MKFAEHGPVKTVTHSDLEELFPDIDIDNLLFFILSPIYNF